MHRIKVSRKGEIVLPLVYRMKLGLETGSTVLVGMKGEAIIVRRPRYGHSRLFGIWSWLSQKTLERSRAAWADWNG